MIETTLADHAGRQHVVRTADDVNRLLAELERHRDRLADTMLGNDRAAAIAAERESDRIEDVYVPRLAAEIERIRALLDTDAADQHRRAKAQAIRDRKRS